MLNIYLLEAYTSEHKAVSLDVPNKDVILQLKTTSISQL